MLTIVNAAALGVLILIAAYLVTLLLDSFRMARAVARGVEAEREYLQAQVAALAAQRRYEEDRAQHGWNGFRKFEIWRKVEEADGISSFYLRPNDKKPLQPFLPGQYLTFRLQLPERRRRGAPVVRCYSLSCAPNPDFYRVTVKRTPLKVQAEDSGPYHGSVSNFFHGGLQEGDIVDVKAPSGQFYLDFARHTPIVLIGGGIGLTPMLSMIEAVVEAGSSREVWLFYGVRHGGEHAMRDQLREFTREHPNIKIVTVYSTPRPGDARGRDFDEMGHVSIDLIKGMLPSSNYDFFLCGPPPMMSTLFDGLVAWGVPEAAIHFEAFGPATVKRVHAPEAAGAAAMTITFAKTIKAVPWDARSNSLLDFAEANGITIAFGCRAGNCGTCVTALKSGEVVYLRPPGEKPEAGSCLACVVVPKTDLVLDA
jgi:ferredoxin-NADP reductase